MRSLLPLVLLAAAPALAQPLAISTPRPDVDGRFGTAVSGVADADGDGRGDFVVGARGEDVTLDGRACEDAGWVYAYSGATGGLLRAFRSPNPACASPFSAGGAFGGSVAGVPDVNGDGRGDFLVGAFLEGPGRAYLYSGATGARLRTLGSPNATGSGSFGYAVAGVADADGDGRGDLLVGAFGEEVGGLFYAGRAYLYSGASGQLLHVLQSPNPEDDLFSSTFGYSVSGVPDVDGDGRGDLLVGAPWENGGAENAGRTYIFSGRTGALLRTLESPNVEIDGFFGYSVSGVADTHGDGRGDLLVGTLNEFQAYLFSGADGTLLHTLFNGGQAVAGVPDVDGDGRGDLAIGAPEAAYVHSGATGQRLYTFRSYEAGDDFGFAVAGVEDANGDGLGDGVVGAPGTDVGGEEEGGRVYFYRTRGSDGAWATDEGVAVAADLTTRGPDALTVSVAPNPLTSATTVRVALPRPSAVTVEALDVLGRRVALLHEGALAAGTHEVRWAPEPALPGGVYLVRLEVEGTSAQVQRVILAR